MAPLTHRRLTNAAEMSALAHPLRLDLLDLLLVNGAMTASEAGRQLNQNPSNVSWHLRKLADHGFVRQAQQGSGRRRPWKIVAESLTWRDAAADDVQAAALRDVAVEREVQVLRSALGAHGDESTAWRRATTLSQARLWLTADEAVELGMQISALIGATADRFGDPARRPDGARLMASMSWIVPAGPEPSDTSS